MIRIKKIMIVLISFALFSCGFNSYGPGLRNESVKKCERLIESMARKNCHEEVSENLSFLKQRLDKEKRENKKELDFTRKNEPALDSKN